MKRELRAFADVSADGRWERKTEVKDAGPSTFFPLEVPEVLIIFVLTF